jgi:hypothetical protein
MDKKSKIFLTVFFGLIVVVIGISFYKYFIAKNYFIKTETVCDPATEKCFVRTCDPADDSECPENEAERISYYKLIEEKAYAIASCDAATEDCENPVCKPDAECTETLCDQSNVIEGEECNDPTTYLENQIINQETTSEADSGETQPKEASSNSEE